ILLAQFEVLLQRVLLLAGRLETLLEVTENAHDFTSLDAESWLGIGRACRCWVTPAPQKSGTIPQNPKVVTDGPMPVGRLYLQWDGLSNRIVRSAERQGRDNDNWMLLRAGRRRQARAGAACRKSVV